MTNVAEMIRELGANFNDTASSLSTRIGDLEKRAAREPDHANDNHAGGQSLAASLVATDAFKQLNGGANRGRAFIESAAITTANSTQGTGRSASTSLVPADRQAGIIRKPDRALTVRDLIAPGKTTSGSIEYVQETGFTNNAAPVAETTQKPYSDITFDLKTVSVRTIAHLFKLSKQMLDDVDGLVSYLDLRGRTGLKIVEENQLLFGSGTGQNLYGLMPQATAFNNSLRKTGDTRIDTIRHAILQVRLSEYAATGIIMNPVDLEALDLTKDAGGNYIISDPTNGGPDRIWRLQIVDTMAMPAGQFLVGAFATAAQVFDRQQVTFEVSTENVDDFEKNMATARIEERLALAVYRPEAMVTGTFTA